MVGNRPTKVSDNARTVSGKTELQSPGRRITLRRSTSPLPPVPLSSSSFTNDSSQNSETNYSDSLSTIPSQSLQAASPPFVMSVAVDNSGQTDNASDPSSIRYSGNSTEVEELNLSHHSHSDSEASQTECPTDTDSHEEEESEQSISSHYSPAHSVTLGESVTFIIRSGAQVAERTLLLLGQSQPPRSHNLHIHRNKQRLTHYIQEPNVGRGFIKEISFSSDGRIICSPFGFGLRLLAFGPQCQELCDLQPERPMQLYELTSNMSHVSSVVASKFSPTHCLLVTGCLNGKVDFHQPVL